MRIAAFKAESIPSDWRQSVVRGATLGLMGIMAAAIIGGLAAPAWAAGFNDAVAKYNSKNYQGALNEFKVIAEKEPRNALCHYYLALCNQCLARVAEAKKEYQLATQASDPGLRAMAQSGLTQLDRVNIGSAGGSSSSSSSSSSAANSLVSSGGGSSAGSGAAGASGSSDKGAGKPGASSTSSSGSSSSTAGGKSSVASGGVKTIYDFYTTWCRPCKLMEPTFDEAKTRYTGITFKRFDAEAPENAAMVQQYGVSAYPTIVFLDGKGKVLYNAAGSLEGDSFFSLIDQYNK